jgi:cytochrome c2
MRTRLTTLAGVLLLLGACRVSPRADVVVPGGDAERGQRSIAGYGCGSCHTIPGVRGAHGLVGPPLTGMASRSYIAGQLANTPENMVRWLMDPPAVEPGTAMPSVVRNEQAARDIAAYLYTLRDIR